MKRVITDGRMEQMHDVEMGIEERELEKWRDSESGRGLVGKRRVRKCTLEGWKTRLRAEGRR